MKASRYLRKKCWKLILPNNLTSGILSWVQPEKNDLKSALTIVSVLLSDTSFPRWDQKSLLKAPSKKMSSQLFDNRFWKLWILALKSQTRNLSDMKTQKCWLKIGQLILPHRHLRQKYFFVITFDDDVVWPQKFVDLPLNQFFA